MRRRGVTVLVGIVLVGVLTSALLWMKVPYVALGPGPTVNTLGDYENSTIIKIANRDTVTPKGQLRLVTVSVSPDVSLVDAIYFWFDHDYAVVPRELVYPPNKTQTQVDNENVQEFQKSQSSAETAALRKLGFPVFPGVGEVSVGKPADGKLKPDDILTSVDGQAVPALADVSKILQAKPAGAEHVIGYTRAGVPGTATITSVAGDAGKPVIGITIKPIQPHPFTIDVKLDKIGGPSAGLLFTLGILAKLDPTGTDITGGVNIAGTGTIDEDGIVGPIGGIPQKLVGAKRDGAKYFLTPVENCAEAVKNAQPGLPLLKVHTLDDALKALADLREHRQPTLCSANDGK